MVNITKVEETSGVYLKDLVINNMVYEKSCISAPRNFYHLTVTVGIIANYPRLVAYSKQTFMVANIQCLDGSSTKFSSGASSSHILFRT
jgi:hypothetical protein